jgi:HrpA-like RNA helicase
VFHILGKSTLLPALLAAEGYDKIIVTQPRRLPCSLISQRVNSMVNDDISGWAVSGMEKNVQAKVLYVTDGLLKERLMNDENFITKNTQLNKSVVFMIDEVHERSVNIDLCLALFARLLELNPELKTKIKVIISSATLDPSVPQLYKQIPGCSLIDFQLTLSTLYPVTFNRVPKENILDLVQKLYSKRIRNDQILCFVGSTHDVFENCELLKKITREAIVAYPLVQSQSAVDQEKYIQQGTVFFSTTVAETSLTFPCLKYVIDTGVINMPIYDLNLERTELKEIKAAQSTTKQRLGRLGRTQSGEYYALYDYGTSMQKKNLIYNMRIF